MKSSRAAHIRRQLPRWISYVKGTSTLHVSLPPTQNPSSSTYLGDYVCDFTAKLATPFEVDSVGVPINRLYDGRPVYFPIAISQKLIAKLQRGDSIEECLPLADWIHKNIDENNAIKTWAHLGKFVTSPYSAMTQGQCLSALIRFQARFPGYERFQNAIDQLCNGLACGESLGIVQTSKEGLPALIETPLPAANIILNGWCFSIWGVFEAALYTGRPDIASLGTNSLHCLTESLEDYSDLWWSYYDDSGRIASPFYHDLHITLMRALYAYSSEKAFLNAAQKYEKQRSNAVCRGLAFTKKVTQKVFELPHPEFSS